MRTIEREIAARSSPPSGCSDCVAASCIGPLSPHDRADHVAMSAYGRRANETLIPGTTLPDAELRPKAWHRASQTAETCRADRPAPTDLRKKFNPTIWRRRCPCPRVGGDHYPTTS